MKIESGGRRDKSANQVASGETLIGIQGALCRISEKLSAEISLWGRSVHNQPGSGKSWSKGMATSANKTTKLHRI